MIFPTGVRNVSGFGTWLPSSARFISGTPDPFAATEMVLVQKKARVTPTSVKNIQTVMRRSAGVRVDVEDAQACGFSMIFFSSFHRSL